MTTHRLDATAATTVDTFDRGHPPVLTVDPGDRIEVTSLDAHGYLSHPEGDAEPPRLRPASGGHCLTGPIAVRGARPGRHLAVRLERVEPADWGWTNAAAVATRVPERLGLTPADRTTLHWSIAGGVARTTIGGREFRRRTAPFLGVLGTAPAEPGPHWTVPPRPGTGGNLDCRDLVVGSTLYLPVEVDRALLLLGDGHAAQGDGEVSGTAIECAMTTTLTVDLVDAELPGLHAEAPAGLITFGLDEDLDVAMGDALDAMIRWLASRYDVPRATALALASTAVDLRITQVANYTWGVHAVLPHDALEVA